MRRTGHGGRDGGGPAGAGGQDEQQPSLGGTELGRDGIRPEGAWLMREDQVLAAVRARPARGWVDLGEGAVLLVGGHLVQTLTQPADLDVACCRSVKRPPPDAAIGMGSSVGACGAPAQPVWRVERVKGLGARRLCLTPRSAAVIVARRGAFERWGLYEGDEVAVSGG